MTQACSFQEFEAIEDAMTANGLPKAQVRRWCLVTGYPSAPEEDEKFRYVYIIAHGDEPGCSFCDTEDDCQSKQSAMDEICRHLKPNAVVFAACCWCGQGPAATQIACGCAQMAAEIVGPAGKITQAELQSSAGRFFAAICTGKSPKAAAIHASLEHHYVVDLELAECEP